MKKKKLSTDFLLPKNNFLIGMGSILNLSGNYFDYNTSNNEIQADKKALLSDWWNVGRDLDTVLKNALGENSMK